MSAPKRIQRQRTKGWRMPEGAVYVGRPSKWGNVFVLVGDEPSVRVRTAAFDPDWTFDTARAARRHAASAFRWQLLNHPNVVGFTIDDVRAELAGRDLACWCPLEDEHGNRVPCHADVLLEIANRGDGQ